MNIARYDCASSGSFSTYAELQWVNISSYSDIKELPTNQPTNQPSNQPTNQLTN
jgi:hypothetical protein